MTTTPRLWKSLTQVNATDGGETQNNGQIIGLNNGGYVVVWTDWSNAYNPIGGAIVGQRYDVFGNKVGGEVEISQFDTGSQFSPAVTRLSNGNIAVAFVDNFKADSIGVGQAIYVRIYNPSLGLIETYVPAVAANVSAPSITALADGGFAISYTKVNSADDTDIVARIVSSTGAFGPQFDVHNQSATAIPPRPRRCPTATSWWFTRTSSTAAQPTTTFSSGSSRRPARPCLVPIPITSSGATAMGWRPGQMLPRSRTAASLWCGRMMVAQAAPTFGRRSTTTPAAPSPPICWSKPRRSGARASRMWWRWATAASS